MKRKFLEELGMDKEVIDKIMAENGSDIEAEKVKTSTAITERDGYKTSLDNNTIELKKFEGLDLEGQKQIIKDLELKNETDTKELQTKLDSQAFNHKAEKFIGGYEFTSSLAKDAALAQLLKQELKLDGETILGAKDFLEKMKTDSPTAFKEKKEDEKPPTNWGNGKPNTNQPPATDYSLSSALRGGK